MAWELRHGNDYRQDAPSMIKAGMNLPFPWQKVPVVDSVYSWYFEAFAELSTCRQFGMSTGPIPWTAAQEYADREEIEEREEFILLIRSMDAEYLKYIEEKNYSNGGKK